MVELESSSNSASAGDASVSSDHLTAPPSIAAAAAATAPPKKKRRNLPGMPDPDAEVIALSPRTLMATNRFVCEVCSKGFQREQNLQLHRRGHNLPWKLRQRTGNEEARKRVYVCPEPGCVHHEPSRALGDLTGIKKHFSRKHGEKKWKCDRCSKKYAVRSDWKAHSKTCGTREYRCDCGTLFSRRDSFITHRAFCDALAEESAKKTQTTTTNAVRSEEENTAPLVAAVDDAPHVVIPAPPAETQQEQEPEEPAGVLQYLPPNADAGSGTMSCGGDGNGSGTSLFASLFSSSTDAASSSVGGHSTTTFSDFIGSMNHLPEPTSLCLSTIAPNPNSLLFSSPPQAEQQFTAPPPPAPSPHLSATALLQKAAQMGATTATSSSFLRGFGLAPSSSSVALQEDSSLQWDGRGHHQNIDPGLGLGLGYDAGNLMLGPSSSFFGTKPATLDLLGLGIGPGGSTTTGGLSALITSMGGGGLDVGPGATSGTSGSAQSWEGSDRKPTIL